MRVLFIQTPSVEGPSQERVYPVGIVILAGSLLRSGHDVEILDMNIETDPFGAVKRKLLSFRPDLVGLSLRNIDPLANKTSSLVPPFLVAARLVASVMPKSWLIAGGTGFSLFPERLMREAPEIHYGIRGEAEISLPLLLASLENPPLIKGLCTRRGKAVRITAPCKSLDMAQCAPPDRSLLNPSLYSGINTYVPSIGIETKRGCPFHCAYCVYPALQGKRLRCRSPKEVVDEMESLNKEYGIERFHFTDPIVNFPGDHLDDICREILRRRLRLKWDGFMREDYFDENNAALFEKAGCECFSFSPDGLCQESLDVLDKRLSERDVLRAATLAAKTDVLSVYHFMVNVPGETEKTCEKGLRFLERIYDTHSRKKNLGTVVLNNIRVLPGTPIEARARASGAIGPETDLLYPTYYNPKPFDAFRYRLEALHLCRNVFMWQEVR
jgi:putative variant cofactor biosynthesis B12-binding/radical SAM domain protein 1